MRNNAACASASSRNSCISSTTAPSGLSCLRCTRRSALSRCFCCRVCSFWRLVKVDRPLGIHNSSLVFIACGSRPHFHTSGCFRKQENLPARFARLACVPLIVVATASSAASTTTKLLSTTSAAAPGAVCLGLRFVDLQRASAQFGSVQRRDCFIRFGGVSHFHEPEAPGSACLPVGNDADFFHCTVSLENRSQLGLGGAVGQISYIKILHCSSSLSKSSKVRDWAARFTSLVSRSRGGTDLSCVARVRACDSERTAEIRREASKIPQRCETPPGRSAASAVLTSAHEA